MLNITEYRDKILNNVRLDTATSNRGRSTGFCWVWTKGVNRQGYGQVHVYGSKKANWIASRLSYAVFKGEIPEGQCVLHSCDLPACCSPYHLRLGTKAENNRDTPLSRKGYVKLSKLQVDEIRLLVACGERQVRVAELFGISQAHVSDLYRKNIRLHR
jgi:HNH endonuclease